MKCATHPDVDAVGVCVNCGKAVCSTCSTVIGEKTYCPACATSISDVVKRKPTAKPVAGGILGIISGILGLFLGFILIAGGYATDYYWESVNRAQIGWGIALVILGILAILGSSFAVARKNYILSLIGGVSALLEIWPLGIPALILIAMSRSEFQHASSSSICVVCGKENPRGARFCMNCSRELPGR